MNHEYRIYVSFTEENEKILAEFEEKFLTQKFNNISEYIVSLNTLNPPNDSSFKCWLKKHEKILAFKSGFPKKYFAFSKPVLDLFLLKICKISAHKRLKILYLIGVGRNEK